MLVYTLDTEEIVSLFRSPFKVSRNVSDERMIFFVFFSSLQICFQIHSIEEFGDYFHILSISCVRRHLDIFHCRHYLNQYDVWFSGFRQSGCSVQFHRPVLLYSIPFLSRFLLSSSL